MTETVKTTEVTQMPLTKKVLCLTCNEHMHLLRNSVWECPKCKYHIHLCVSFWGTQLGRD
jgi:transposase